MSLCELADKVPNIQGMPEYNKFTGDQILNTNAYLQEKRQEKRQKEVVATYGAPAEVLK
ncbi:hypothetical protein MKX01_030818, partial [Papaver californicum]